MLAFVDGIGGPPEGYQIATWEIIFIVTYLSVIAFMCWYTTSRPEAETAQKTHLNE